MILEEQSPKDIDIIHESLLIGIQLSPQILKMLLLKNNNHHHNLFMYFGYIICFATFMIWLINAIEKFRALPTSSKVSFKYGDEGDKLLRFPIVTLCKDFKSVQNMCSSTDYYESPYFINYIESCLTAGESVEELVKKVSFISRPQLYI